MNWFSLDHSYAPLLAAILITVAACLTYEAIRGAVLIATRRKKRAADFYEQCSFLVTFEDSIRITCCTPEHHIWWNLSDEDIDGLSSRMKQWVERKAEEQTNGNH